MGMNEMALMMLGQQKSVQLADFHLEAVKSLYQGILERQQEVGGTLQYRVKPPSGGGTSFEIVTGDDDLDTTEKTFSGVIVFHHKCNALFEEDSAGNTPPICSSIDAIRGLNSATGEVKNCKSCPFNEYGSSKKGRGKACKNMHKLYIMTDKLPIPLVLALPPTSLKSFQTYCLNTLSVRALKPQDVVTEFYLTAETNADKIKYSVVKFKLLGQLEEQEKPLVSFFQEGLSQVASVAAEDYNREERKVSVDVSPDLTDFPEDFPFPENPEEGMPF